MFSDAAAWRRAESLRSCNVTATGKLYISPTGYYATNMAVSDPALTPDSSCQPFPIKPDLSVVGIPHELHTYRVSITVDYRGKGRVEVKVWKNRNQRLPLQPWQAYVHYFLNGATDGITFGCRQGFRLKDITQTPKSSSSFFLIDEEEAQAGLQDLEGSNAITFVCEKGLPGSSR